MRQRSAHPITQDLTRHGAVAQVLYSSQTRTALTLVRLARLQTLHHLLHYASQSLQKSTRFVHRHAVVIADRRLVARTQEVETQFAVVNSLLLVKRPRNAHEAEGMALEGIVAHALLSLHQNHLARLHEKVDVFVNATEFVQTLVRLTVALEQRRALAQRLNDRVTAHARVAHHAHRQHFPAGLLQIAQTGEQVVVAEVVVEVLTVARVLCDAQAAVASEFGGGGEIAILEADHGEVFGERVDGLGVRRRGRGCLGQDVARNKIDFVQEDNNDLFRHFFGNGLFNREATRVLHIT